MERMKILHGRCRRNRQRIQAETHCGCFYCGARFTGIEITNWIREKDGTGEMTAMCPVCGVDAVLYGDAEEPITAELLEHMGAVWFGEAAEDGRKVYKLYQKRIKEE